MIPLPFFYALLLLLFLFITFYIYKEYVKATYRGAYFLPTKATQVATIIEFLNTHIKEHLLKKDIIKIVDLGSGTGTILMKLIKEGFYTDGFEINGLLYFINYIKLLFSSFRGNSISNIHRESFWNANLSKYNVAILYGIGYMLEDIQTKILTEITKGSIIISIRFPLTKLQLLKEDSGVYFYKI